jgi:hypothetical protein
MVGMVSHSGVAEFMVGIVSHSGVAEFMVGMVRAKVSKGTTSELEIIYLEEVVGGGHCADRLKRALYFVP